MAYNLQSLITILEQILNPEQTRWIVDHNKPIQLESLLEKAASLQQILEKSSLPKLESLETQIRDAAHKAEDIIESHMVDEILSSPGESSFTFSAPDLQQVMEELDSAKEQVVKLVEEKNMSSGSSSSGASLPWHDPSSKSIVVGVDEDLMQLKDRLTGTQSKLEIVPIVGMGGIGKTTLARKLYEDKLIVEHFEFLAWTTISQDYNMKAILCGIIGKAVDEISVHELKDILYKRLFGRRYMIVLDDTWSTEVWDEIKMYLPDNNNGSRIVITTRELDVAKHADSRSVQHQVQLLSESDSWNLLRQIVFGEEDCPNELQGIGEKIGSDCGGLPLAINVIGGLLSKLQRSRDVWENIGDDVRVAIAESEGQFSNILSLSYDHLPNHLKPCFLYMGAFPEDYEIKASKLICMWVAEGFVKSNGDKSLEEEAEDYLQALVDRNLFLIKEEMYNGKVKRCSMHDLLRDLCMRKGDEENFVHVVKNASEVTVSNLRRVSVGSRTSSRMEDVYASSAELMSLVRSFILTETDFMWDEILSPAFFALRLLRVLDIMGMTFQQFPEEILQLVNLRYLAVSKSSIPSGISRLRNLQTLIGELSLDDVPCEIWEMSELRHLKLNGLITFEDEYMKRSVQKNLQTLSNLWVTRSLIRRRFFESIPNIKELGIYYDDELPSIAIDLSHLHKLETLKCDSYLDEDCCRFLPTLRFPSTLRKLALSRCVLFPRVMTTLCALPNLEVLSMRKCLFESEEEEVRTNDQVWEVRTNDQVWEVAEGDEFRSLHFLKLDSLKLVRWRADETNFPTLRQLVIKHCTELEEIPRCIGEIPTLQLIDVYRCSDSAAASARQIQEVQQSDYDNYDLTVSVL